MNPPNLKTYRDSQPLQTINWTVAMQRTALAELEQGYFYQAGMLADAMSKDQRISATFRARIRALLGLPRSFVPNGETRAAKKIAQALEEDFAVIAPPQTITALMRWVLLVGVGVAEMVWERQEKGDTTRWIPRWKVWHPQFLSYRWDTRTFWLATESGPLEIHPGDGQWVILQLGSERPWMEGLIRELAIPYLIRQFAIRDWARYSEVHGLPTKIARVPGGSSDDDKKMFFDSIRKLGSEALVKMVQTPDGTAGFDLSLLEAKANTWAGFQGLIQQMDSSIAISILGQNLTTEVKGGSRSAAEVHERKELDVIEADVAVLENAFSQQTIPWWVNINYGNVGNPRVQYDVQPPENAKLRAETLNIIADVLPKLQQAGVNITPILEAYDLEPADVSNAPAPVAQLSKRLEQLITKKDFQLSSGDGFTNGQLYADEVADGLLEHQTLESETKKFLTIIQDAEDFEGLRSKLLEVYGNMKPDDLRELLEKATVVADFSGRYAVLEDAS